MSERRLAHLTEWIRKRPGSIEFWELFVTSERLIWCFAGESFSSVLLRADMGERTRQEISGLTNEGIANHDERNFTVPLSALERIRLVRGTRLRRARVEIEWTDEVSESVTLYDTKAGDDQHELFERLAEEPALEGVAVGIESPSLFRRS